ncbi:hypothetical protein ACFLYG_04070 [Chloroflexota bacterium]
MPAGIKRVERIVEDENSQLKSIQEGITEGILEGIREGVMEGLKKGVRDGLKECLTEGLGNVTPVDIKDVLDGIGEDAVKVTVRESTKNLFSKSAEAYMRGICERVVNEVQKQHVKLTKAQIPFILSLVTKSEQETAKRVMERLPDNPFVKEFAAGIQAAFEESLKKELKLCEDRLRQKAASSS